MQAANNMNTIAYDLTISDVNIQFLYMYISRKLKEPSSQVWYHLKLALLEKALLTNHNDYVIVFDF